MDFKIQTFYKRMTPEMYAMSNPPCRVSFLNSSRRSWRISFRSFNHLRCSNFTTFSCKRAHFFYSSSLLSSEVIAKTFFIIFHFLVGWYQSWKKGKYLRKPKRFLVLLKSTKKCHIGRHIHLVSLVSTKQKEIQYNKTKRVYSASI